MKAPGSACTSRIGSWPCSRADWRSRASRESAPPSALSCAMRRWRLLKRPDVARLAPPHCVLTLRLQRRSPRLVAMIDASVLADTIEWLNDGCPSAPEADGA